MAFANCGAGNTVPPRRSGSGTGQEEAKSNLGARYDQEGLELVSDAVCTLEAAEVPYVARAAEQFAAREENFEEC